MRHSVVDCLRLRGWLRDDTKLDPDDEQWGPSECVAVTGCSRLGRWTHPYVVGNYCAQHAHAAGRYGHDS